MAELIYGGTGVWFMIGALLVFFMQCGFAMSADSQWLKPVLQELKTQVTSL